MLLCPNHHHEATVKAMLEDEQKFYKSNPYNIKRGFVEGILKVSQKTPAVTIGSTLFVGDGSLISVDDENLISLQIVDGRLELSVKLYDKNDDLIAEIRGNEWISGDPLPWDLEAKFQWLRVRRKLRDISLEVDVRRVPINIRADIWRKKQNFQINPKEILFNGVVKQVSIMGGCLVGAYLNADTSKQKYTINPFPRFGKYRIISGSNVGELVKKGLIAWEKLSCRHEFMTIINKKRYTVRECNKCKEIEKIWK